MEGGESVFGIYCLREEKIINDDDDDDEGGGEEGRGGGGGEITQGNKALVMWHLRELESQS